MRAGQRAGVGLADTKGRRAPWKEARDARLLPPSLYQEERGGECRADLPSAWSGCRARRTRLVALPCACALGFAVVPQTAPVGGEPRRGGSPEIVARRQRIAAFDTCTCAPGLPPVVRLTPARCHPSSEGTSPADALQVRGRSLLGRSTLPAWLREGQDSPLASCPRAAGDARASPPTRRLGRRRRLALAISRVLSGCSLAGA